MRDHALEQRVDVDRREQARCSFGITETEPFVSDYRVRGTGRAGNVESRESGPLSIGPALFAAALFAAALGAPAQVATPLIATPCPSGTLRLAACDEPDIEPSRPDLLGDPRHEPLGCVASGSRRLGTVGFKTQLFRELTRRHGPDIRERDYDRHVLNPIPQ
jgi:hypothetical protein